MISPKVQNRMPHPRPERNGSHPPVGAAPVRDGGAAVLSHEEFADRFQGALPVLWTIAAGVLGDRSQVEDTLQEACVIALQKLDRFRPGTSFGAWMGAVVRNVARNTARKGRRQATAPVAPEALGEMLDDQTRGRGLTGGDPEAASDRGPIDERGRLRGDVGAFDDALTAGLAALRPIPRAALLLRALSGLEYKEIGAVLGIPEGTAMSHVHRSRQALRRRLEGLAPQDGPHPAAREVR